MIRCPGAVGNTPTARAEECPGEMTIKDVAACRARCASYAAASECLTVTHVLCRVALCCVVLRCVVLRCVVLCCVVLCCAVVLCCCIVLCCVVLC